MILTLTIIAMLLILEVGWGFVANYDYSMFVKARTSAGMRMRSQWHNGRRRRSDMMQHESIWQQSTDIPRREALACDLEVDAAVIGAGMAGILIANALRQQGLKVVVLEARRIGSGQTAHTTAKITSQHGLIYHGLIERFGREKAQQYADANQQAIRAYARMIHEREIDCAFREAPAYLYSCLDAAPLQKEAEAAASLGIRARFTADSELPFPIAGAVRFDGQAVFHPLRFLRAISEALDIYEDTPVLSVDGHMLHTPGGKVRANHVIFACHYPFVNVPGWYFMRMHQERSYVLALDHAWLPDGTYYSADQAGLSLRAAEDHLLVGGENHRTGENSQGGRYEALRQQASALFPGCREVARWSAQDCMTLDGLPYIGPFAASVPSWYVATGFGKWGMTTSMVAAMLITGAIAGHKPDWAEVFSPSRFELSVSAGQLATDTAQALKGLTREIFMPPRALLDELPAGHGGIVEVHGQKAGVYKTEDGTCYVVTPRCPHLGCQLEWNPDEKSWDCPCHGSRFHYDGTLISGPAQQDLSH